ncbi:class I mannose-6-phosphate isomerase [Ferruginibacter albus]|uniref:class I mannose-6-phosphate isomerase n=1 Tax=Ferruginibacter albus TaxID=2875540 RepID=UPI001CC7EF6E|nr:class I mannose-6-phosphate isomerase [Ferruginibacter albus]UAY51934.1 class I mannose-6-phosphate isomerase [Ferruginibacter albus]
MSNSNFDKFPAVAVKGYKGFAGWKDICDELSSKINALGKSLAVIVLEFYHGVFADEIIAALKRNISNSHFINVEAAMSNKNELDEKLFPFVTDDPVFGYITPLDIKDFYNTDKLNAVEDSIGKISEGVIFLYGTGASLIESKPDILIYADMPRWEIQLRFRKNQVSNLGADNFDDAFAYQYKRSFFVDWRVCDKTKKELLPKSDYVLDTTANGQPKMITGKTLQAALEEAVKRPFRVVPFFDPGPWGGQWLKEICDLDRSAPNYAWAFDCVPEENSLLLSFDNLVFETPSINAVFFQPKSLLGTEVWKTFGEEFPIRFDFLDTMGGGNLSLQVHPLKEYIQEQFGMDYTQDESYYFMDAKEDAFVYLGLKENIDPDNMIKELEEAQEDSGNFDAEKFVEKFPIKKHDHALIPAGTVHCSGANSVVLEISATPYIFTFKLWDWGRMGLDGKPRPISLQHGKRSIQWNRTTQWTKDHLLNQFKKIDEGDGWIEEKTGLHEGFFIETRRHWFSHTVTHNTNGVVNVLNLIEGKEAIVESPENNFKPFVVHYAETFIVPAAVGVYTIRPHGVSTGETCGTLKAIINPNNLPKPHTN